eukprot:CAMPEP_0114241130 /NCGR_PEP_ID=MMETSP0058-20121206/9473_1 /TAXON_ID=36894 /ORGANISM="Pyramimonas parkeae, CCMP726" /LENGTH=896 /DNA_ID=CAMNT_0001353645 /DNA_START=274 /DNA_END=2964 /DNA_ORIENTATION=+
MAVVPARGHAPHRRIGTARSITIAHKRSIDIKYKQNANYTNSLGGFGRIFETTRSTSVRSRSSSRGAVIARGETCEVHKETFSRVDEVGYLSALKERILAATSLETKHECLDKELRVQRFLADFRGGELAEEWEGLGSTKQYYLKCLAAIGQEHVLTVPEDLSLSAAKARLASLLELADHLEKFYDVYGGIIGYQLTVLELMEEAIQAKAARKEASQRDGARPPAPQGAAPAAPDSASTSFHIPAGINLSAEPDLAVKAAGWGLMALPQMAEMYPVGGAGDRLGLVDEETGEGLPAAMLPYCGRTMFDGLMRDLQAREYLYFRVFGVQHTTPVAVMTSAAKRNHQRLSQLCHDKQWFGRPKESFRLIQQSLVPVVTVSGGKWQLKEGMQPALKPGGHGVMWKLARDSGVFDWFKQQGRTATLVRQISNPLAGTDSTLLALSGMGQARNKAMGFASCERRIGAAEGMNVLTEQKTADGKWKYGVSNIEYTDFETLGVQDEGATPGSKHSKFPANTNILYLGLEPLERALQQREGRAALPGMLVNLTKAVAAGAEQVCRLECSMQSVAESLMDEHDRRLSASQWDNLSTFVSYNMRSKVTSSAKKKLAPGSTKLGQTPEGSFLTLQKNAGSLLASCGMRVPEMRMGEEYLSKGPSFLAWMHPALGPLWRVTRQKIQGGRLMKGAELALELAELALQDVVVDGSLLIHAEDVMGHMSEGPEPTLQYSDRCGRCRLVNVRVKNDGCDWSCKENVYWRNQVARKEAMRVRLEGNSEFEASNVTIRGNQSFTVPDGFRMHVSASREAKCGWEATLVPLVDGKPTWRWNISLDESDGHMSLQMEEAAGESCEGQVLEQDTVDNGGRRWRRVPWRRFGNGNAENQDRRSRQRFRRGKSNPPIAA